jgi:hypothetical protein
MNENDSQLLFSSDFKRLFSNPNPISCFMQIKHFGLFKKIFLKMIFIYENMSLTGLEHCVDF